MNTSTHYQTFRKTKIVATLGPSCNTIEKMVEMINAGMNCSRFNFSHGDHAEHKERLDKLREAMKITGKKVALLLDTKGPEIRTGNVETAPIELEQNQEILVSGQTKTTTDKVISLSYSNIHKELDKGIEIKIADGAIILRVLEIEDTNVRCVVLKGGTLGSKKNVNIPDSIINLPDISNKDILDIKFAVEHNYDYIAASFIRNATAVLKIQEILKKQNSTINIIAKIENQEGLDNLESIIQIADGIMVARGDLAEQIPPEQVPLMQKHIIKYCLENHKIAITATQMLQSMEVSFTPTRAELTDIANAIFDGTDAIMLSGETARGKYPIEAIATMHRIALAVEESDQFKIHATKTFFAKEKDALFIEGASGDSIVSAAQIVADKINATALVCPSLTGNTPKLLSVHRPSQPIISPSHLESIYTKLLLLWGTYPIMIDSCNNDQELIDTAIVATADAGFMNKNDKIVIIAGLPINKPLMLNTVQVYFNGTVIARGRQGCGPIVQGRFFRTPTIHEAITHKASHSESYIYCIPKFTYDDIPHLQQLSGLLIETPSEVPIEIIMKKFPNLAFVAHINALMFQEIKNEREIVISGTEKYIYEP